LAGRLLLSALFRCRTRLFDSLASHHNHWKSNADTAPLGGSCTLPVAIEASLMAPHGPADPHQLVRQRHGGLVMADGAKGDRFIFPLTFI